MKLKDYLKGKGISPRAFAIRMGVSPAAIHRITGANSEGKLPSFGVAVEIFEATGGAVGLLELYHEAKAHNPQRGAGGS